MKKLLLMSVVFMLMGVLCCESAFAGERFVTFPGVGVCTGTYVRYREDPDTESEILGRLNTPDRVVVLSQVAVDGDVWYEIEDPNGDRPAYVFGKYVVPVFGEKLQRTKTYSLIVNILQDYGATKGRAEFYNGPKVKTRYTENNLSFIDATRKGTAFGEIKVGDSRNTIEHFLEDPDIDDEDMLEYRLDFDTCVRFILEDDEIVRMVFEF
ncbi:MAG: SH3 domain-containing protein [Synergistaceae bacterium]|nr:SH3 domain-containing protein [Synergistaceae bacterium]